nr:reverse transcriptase domain-containing protein [Tanacetum cinerariifolium]
MPFSLKNFGATYQRLVDKAFDSQIGWNIEVYVDDLVIKSHTEAKMLRDIGEMFRTLRKINMKLNPKKCTFGVVKGMFLGYMITPEEIKSCPDKTKDVLQLPSPRTIKEIQSLIGKLATKHAFKQLKRHLSELPLLVAPKPKEELIVYLSASYGAISAVLMTERGTVKTPVYFVIRTLQGPKLNYTPMEKLVLSLVFAAKRLQRTGLSGFPYRNARRNSARRISSINSTRAVDTLHGWIFAASNNEAEYEALIAGLRIAAQMGVQNVYVSVDYKLVANQVLRAYVAKEENMIKYLEKVKSLVSGFVNFSINQVPRSKNKKADALSKIALTNFTQLSKQVLVEILKEKSIQEKEVTTVVEENGTTWMTPIIEYLKERTLPEDRKEARKLCIKARQYELLEGVLYRRSFLTLWLRCVGPLQADYVIREIYEGSCSMHAGPRGGIDIDGPFPEGPGKSLEEGIKARLGEGNKNWIKELPHVLWDHRTMIKSSHGDTPFFLTYGTKAVMPAEIGMQTYRTATVDVVHNDEDLRLNLDLLEERRERVATCEAKAKLKMTKYYNARVRGVTFRLGDFSTAVTTLVMLWMGRSSVQSGKDLTR